jgi:hypothetical protein
MQRDLLARADATVAGGFACMSVICGDLVAHERGGGSVRELARDLEARGAPIPILDPFLAWYPGWTGPQISGYQGDAQNVDAATVLRFAEELGARSLSVLAPFHGSPAPREEVLDALGVFADRAAAIDLLLHIEVIPTSMVPDLESGSDMVEGSGATTSAWCSTRSIWDGAAPRRRICRRSRRTGSSTCSSATRPASPGCPTTSRRP